MCVLSTHYLSDSILNRGSRCSNLLSTDCLLPLRNVPQTYDQENHQHYLKGRKLIQMETYFGSLSVPLHSVLAIIAIPFKSNDTTTCHRYLGLSVNQCTNSWTAPKKTDKIYRFETWHCGEDLTTIVRPPFVDNGISFVNRTAFFI